MAAEPTQTTGIHIRWMIRRDMTDVLEIENASFEFPWNEDDFVAAYVSEHIGMVVEQDDEIVGFMIYELYKTRLHILNFAVHQNQRRSGIGTVMVEKLKSKLSHQRRNRIVLEVRETNLEAQLFLNNRTFLLCQFLELPDDTVEDAYLMQHRYVDEQVEVPVNRITRMAG